MFDYHVHPDFSQDAQGSIRDYCRRAQELGLEEICFTTHYEPDPKRHDREFVRVGGRPVPVDSDWPKAYFAEIEAGRREFPKVTIRAGVEVGYEIGLEDTIGDFLNAYPFDFVLGAVHCLDHVALTSSKELEAAVRDFGDKEPEEIVTRYFDYIQAAADSRLFDCMAHLDIYRKYIQPLFGPRFGKCADNFIGGALKHIAQAGIGIEVNTSAFRRGMVEPYPKEKIIRMAWDTGIRSFTTGSDAHRTGDLGSGIERAELILADIGVTPARFEYRHRIV